MSETVINKFKWPIIGHSNIVDYLQNSLESLGVSHAYLFVGQDGVGKKITADYFASSLVCRELEQSAKKNVPCGACECCKQVSNHTHPDIFWVKRELNEKTDKLKKNISIEQVRQLQGQLSMGSFMNTYKVAIITEAEKLSLEAANALLKTLEEPTQKTVLILLASNLTSLPKTIGSRCQVLRFLPVSSQEIYQHLVARKIDKKKAKTLAAISYGRPGLALNFAANKEDYQSYLEDVRQFNLLVKSATIEKFKILGGLAKLDNDSLKRVLNIWLKIMRDSLLLKNNSGAYISHINFEADIENLSSQENPKLFKMISEVEKAKKYIDENVNTRLILENLALTF